MLSFGYALLTRTWLTALSAVGFDPYLGFYHKPRFGRPALAALRKWRYEAPTPGHPSLTERTRVRIEFQLSH